MGERFGVGVGLVSCSCGAAAAVATRYLIHSADLVTLAAIRFGGGVVCLLPLVVLVRPRWPRREDWPAVALLGLVFYAFFFLLYNLALSFTTVARGTLALSMLPLMTMVAAAVLGVEALTARKTAGVGIAVLGVAVALGSSVAGAPSGAWRGDLIMAGATFCMAIYSVFSRPFVARASALGFLTAGMAVGGGFLVVTSVGMGGAADLADFDGKHWAAAAYLAAGGGALAFFLWVVALQHATPTRVANTMTINPLVAGLLAVVVLGEPITAELLVGLAAVGAGIWLATTESAAPADAKTGRG